MRVLGIETSCDETAAAIVEIGEDNALTLLSNVVASSMELHVQYGGVVPEIAARSHIEAIIPVIDEAVEPVGWDTIDAIAVTYGAGLGGSLLVGVMTARSLAIAKDKPLYAINHVEGHVYANFITKVGRMSNSQLAISNKLAMGNERLQANGKSQMANVLPIANGQLQIQSYSLPPSSPKFPILALIVSGGHSQLVLFRDHFDYTLLGRTQDDAVGEAFDKVAKMIGLPYPGGPSIGKKALEGDAHAFRLPKAKMPHKYDFSFSGLKTAVLRRAQAMCGQDFTFPSKNLPDRLSEAQKADIAATFQRVAIETVVDKTIAAYEEYSPASVVIAGGVAASPEQRHQLRERLAVMSDARLAMSDKLAISNGQLQPHGQSPMANVLQIANGKLPISDRLHFTDPKLCTDNGAMVAALGAFKASLGQKPADPYTLDIAPNLSM